jgi:hypothetical protein
VGGGQRLAVLALQAGDGLGEHRAAGPAHDALVRRAEHAQLDRERSYVDDGGLERGLAGQVERESQVRGRRVDERRRDLQEH